MKKEDPERRAELTPLDVIRVETAMSRYPIHRLAKQGSIAIELREATEEGETTLRWEIGHHSKYGQPGPLARGGFTAFPRWVYRSPSVGLGPDYCLSVQYRISRYGWGSSTAFPGMVLPHFQVWFGGRVPHF